MEKRRYTGNETFQILVWNFSVRQIIEEWEEREIATDLRLRRAKTRGHTVIETKDVLFANSIRQWHPGCQVFIKDK